jgi:hypothetical protein
MLVTYLSRNTLKLLPLVATAVVAVAVAGPAAAKSAKSTPPCWKTLINDWYDGRIDGTYAIPCYREALNHLPTDVETYSSARDDIKQALQERITQGRKGGGTGTTGGSGGATGTTGGATGGGTGGTGGGTGGTKSGGGSAGSGTSGGGKSASSPIGDVFNSTKPAKADSIPIPLIVLGAVALLLMAAGAAGFVARRMRTRRLELASAATLQERPGTRPPAQP